MGDFEKIIFTRPAVSTDEDLGYLPGTLEEKLAPYIRPIYDILYRFLDVLRQIEDGELDQHEGSFVVGTLLKELYVDSALKKAEKLEKENAEKDGKIVRPEPLKVSWKQFKSTQLP
jgi:hypothetical protein